MLFDTCTEPCCCCQGYYPLVLWLFPTPARRSSNRNAQAYSVSVRTPRQLPFFILDRAYTRRRWPCCKRKCSVTAKCRLQWSHQERLVVMVFEHRKFPPTPMPQLDLLAFRPIRLRLRLMSRAPS